MSTLSTSIGRGDVQFVDADPREIEVDAIVNLVGGDLRIKKDVSIGLSDLLKEDEVEELNNALIDWKRSRFLGRVPLGLVAVTKAPEGIRAKLVIHGVVGAGSKTPSTWEETLVAIQGTVLTVLRVAEELGVRSVAIPLSWPRSEEVTIPDVKAALTRTVEAFRRSAHVLKDVLLFGVTPEERETLGSLATGTSPTRRAVSRLREKGAHVFSRTNASQLREQFPEEYQHWLDELKQFDVPIQRVSKAE